MKTITLIAALLIGGQLFAQTDSTKTAKKENYQIQTLIKPGMSLGGYFALNGGGTVINNKSVMTVGSRFGLTFGHCLTLGFSGTGFSNTEMPTGNFGDTYNFIAGGYGGFLIEPTLFSKQAIHLTFPIMIGAGGISYNQGTNDFSEDMEVYTEDADAFWIVEPGVELELNIMKHLRLGFGVSYRYTEEINLKNTKVDALNGLTGSITMKIGKF